MSPPAQPALNAADFPPEALLPHRPPMLWLSAIVGARGAAFGARVRLAEHHAWRAADGQIPAWVGLEFMAQTVAARAGWEQLRGGQTPRPGFLLGCRQARMRVPVFRPDQTLAVWCEGVTVGEELGSYACWIDDAAGAAGPPLMTATLTVYQPREAAAVLARREADHESS